MGRSGWIRLHRKLKDHPFWRQHRRFSRAEAWLDLLMDAHWQDEEVPQGGQLVLVKRGQVLFSARRKAEIWGWSRNTTLDWFRFLEAHQMVSREVSHGPDGGYTLLTIVNYDKNQNPADVMEDNELSHGMGHDLSHARATLEPRTEQREEVKKGEKENPAGDGAPAGQGNGKASRREKKLADPNVKLVIDAYHVAFQEKFGSPPPINGGKCGAIAKKLLAGRSPDEAVWLVREFLASPPQFFADRNLVGLEHVLSAAPTLLARRATEGGLR